MHVHSKSYKKEMKYLLNLIFFTFNRVRNNDMKIYSSTRWEKSNIHYTLSTSKISIIRLKTLKVNVKKNKSI